MDSQKLTDTDYNGEVIREFQLANISISEKSKPDFGLKISRKIWGQVTSGLGGYTYNRNARFIKNRNWANGRIDVQTMFQDRFQFNAKQNYIRLVWNTLQIVNRIVSGLVGRWMLRGEKIVVQAVDDLSQNDKQDQYDQIQFIIENKEALEKLQESSGVKMIPDTVLPADKEELNLWKLQFQRIPEEIENELGVNEVLSSNGWYDVLKEKMLHDSAEVGLVGTNTYMDKEGIIHVDWVKPENMIYSASDYNDMRDTYMRGEIPDISISMLRKFYGKEFNPDNPNALTEQQLFEVSQTAKEYKSVTNLSWQFNVDWNVPFSLRPYDEWNVRCMKFEIRTVDNEPYTVTTTKATSTTYTQKGTPVNKNGNPKKPSDNQKVIEDTNMNIYRGVYLPDNDLLLEWGLKKNMIRPQDPKEVGNAEFSYSYYMYQNWQMRNLAIPEKIEAAVDNMILACLKIQQVIARMRPTGAAINADALQEIDFGLGDDGNKIVDPKRLYDQTGDIYYRGRDAEGNPIPIPIQELANTGFLGQMQGLIQDYQFWYQTLKDELGEDPNLITAALQPRVTAQNVETSQSTAAAATDHFYQAYAECMKMTARKISCLLKDSITYGAKAYRAIVKQDISDRIFSTDIRFTPTQQEMAMFEATMQKALDNTPELALFITPFQLTRVAQEDVKLAELLFRQGQKKMLLWKQQTAQENQQTTIQGQIASAQAAEQSKQQTEQVKIDGDLQKVKMEGETMNKNAVVAMVTSLLSKGMPIPANLIPVVNVVMENIIIPLAAENDQQKVAIIQQYQQAQQEQQGQMQQAPQGQIPQQQQPQQQSIQSQPPPQVAA